MSCNKRFFSYGMSILYFLISLVFFFPASCATRGTSPDPPQTVDHVDLSRYTGLWYEIARIPNRFQQNCAGDVTASYALRPDGRIDVVNRCAKTDGETIASRGVARVVDNSTNAKLEVSFLSILGVRLFWGDYWILDLSEDYGYAVIGTPNRKYGWILSRTPALPESTLQQVFRKLQIQGYDPAAFESTGQSGLSPSHTSG